jgi:hypothetical protein
LSSSANHIFDITVGVSTASTLYPNVTTAGQQTKKKNIYNQMSQILVGYDATGSVLHFDKDGDLTGGDKYEDVLIILIYAWVGSESFRWNASSFVRHFPGL